jgi:hypothetical protein
MACVALIHAATNEYDLRADTREELDAAIEKIATDWQTSCGRTFYVKPKPMLAPLQMLNGQWRAIVVGESRHFSCTETVISNAKGQEPCAAVCARSPAPTGCASNGDTEE